MKNPLPRYCLEVLVENLTYIREYLLFLAINIKSFSQTISSKVNLITVLLFWCLVLSGLRENLTNRMRALYDCVKIVALQVMTNF